MRIFIFAAAILFSQAVNAADVPRTPTAFVDKGVQVFTWSGLDGDDTGVPVNVSKCRELTAHIYSGTYGGSTITLEGSVDPRGNPAHADAANAEWAGLADNSGTAISKTADAIESVQEHPIWLRPKTAAGTGANIMVGLVCQP